MSKLHYSPYYTSTNLGGKAAPDQLPQHCGPSFGLWDIVIYWYIIDRLRISGDSFICQLSYMIDWFMIDFFYISRGSLASDFNCPVGSHGVYVCLTPLLFSGLLFWGLKRFSVCFCYSWHLFSSCLYRSIDWFAPNYSSQWLRLHSMITQKVYILSGWHIVLTPGLNQSCFCNQPQMWTNKNRIDLIPHYYLIPLF